MTPARFLSSHRVSWGTEGRNYLRGPGFDNLNFSLVKDTAVGFLGEGGKVEFRAEFFNLFNHPNFASPALAAATAYAGTCVGRRNDYYGLRTGHSDRAESERRGGNHHRNQRNFAPDSVWTEDFVLTQQ